MHTFINSYTNNPRYKRIWEIFETLDSTYRYFDYMGALARLRPAEVRALMRKA